MEKNNSKNSILNYLTTEEKEQFLNELLIATDHFYNKGDSDHIRDCLDRWDDIAELNSIPNFKKNVLERFNVLKCAGKI